MRLTATYAGQDSHGNFLLKDVSGDEQRDHRWLNGARSAWPDWVPTGARVRFFASRLHTHRGVKLTDVREVEVI